MKIGDRNGVQDSRLTGSAGVEPRPGAAGGGGEQGADDHVDVSDTSRALARLFSAANSASAQGPERSQLVAALRSAIESGTYQPDPQVTARNLLLEELA